MAKSIFLQNIVIIVNKVVFTTVMRRINVDYINLSTVRLFKQAQRVQVISLQ